MENIKCSYCGKESVSIEEQEIELCEPYGDSSIVKIKELVCDVCGFAEEDESNDLIIQKELSILKRTSMVKVLDTLNHLGYSNASMERALGLPARTLARWKNEQSMSPSASGIALMRIIRTFPWILSVAELKFDKKAAQAILLARAAQEMINIQSDYPGWKITSSAYISENFHSFHVEGLRNTTAEAVSGTYQVVELGASYEN